MGLPSPPTLDGAAILGVGWARQAEGMDLKLTTYGVTPTSVDSGGPAPSRPSLLLPPDPFPALLRSSQSPRLECLALCRARPLPGTALLPAVVIYRFLGREPVGEEVPARGLNHPRQRGCVSR